ncbi:MAG: hypothetical protein C5B51_27905 [Terriglobia bacterium]|nr:MAG: hypothetical protein C5B51_27905 [Terriglobia bacterium]
MSATQPIKVLVVGASPDALNINTEQRGFLARGFGDLLPPDCVKNTSLELGPQTAMDFSPNLILVFGSCCPDQCEYVPLRRAAESVGAHLAFWLHDDPYEFDYGFKVVEFADTIFTNDRWALEHYRAGRVFHLPMAACPHTHYCDLETFPEKSFDIFFAGAAFENRINMIRDLLPTLRRYRTCIRGSGWPDELPIAQNRWIANRDLPKFFAQSRVVLNLGRDFDLGNERYRLPATTPGPRTFEAAMAGCVQLYFLTGLEIEEYFTPGEEILLFDHASDVSELVACMVGDPERARRIAAASQKRALDEHSYAARAKRILQVCFDGGSS